MSDTMLLGVLRMPIQLWQDSELDKLQRHSRYIEAADRIEQNNISVEVLDQFVSDEDAIHVLKTYLKLHEGKIGAHWLWCVIERIARGESEFDVLWDYGYVYSDEVVDMNGQKPPPDVPKPAGPILEGRGS